MAKARLHELYETTVRPSLMQEFGYKNPMQVPRLEKIVVNMGSARRYRTPRRSRPPPVT
jgi:large subunit ribosomal protein L5